MLRTRRPRRQRRSFQRVLDLQPPLERVEGTRRGTRPRDETDVARPQVSDIEVEMASEAVQSQRVGLPVDRDLRAPRPADDGKQDGGGVGPDVGVRRPKERHAADIPGAKLGAATGDRGGGLARPEREKRGRAQVGAPATALLVPAKDPIEEAACGAGENLDGETVSGRLTQDEQQRRRQHRRGGGARERIGEMPGLAEAPERVVGQQQTGRRRTAAAENGEEDEGGERGGLSPADPGPPP